MIWHNDYEKPIIHFCDKVQLMNDLIKSLFLMLDLFLFSFMYKLIGQDAFLLNCSHLLFKSIRIVYCSFHKFHHQLDYVP